MKTVRIAFAAAVLAAAWFAASALAQSEPLKMSLSRDFGYSLGGDIQGTFSFHVSGPSDLVRVDFYIDQTKIGEDTTAPYSLQFNTDNYPLGTHEMYALGYTSGGQELRSNTATANFVSASEGGAATLRIVVPILIVVFAAMVLSAVLPILTGRRKGSLPPGTQRKYTFGGSICPRCKRPFPLPLLGMNWFVGKITRCPNCGRWGLFREFSIADLRAAEQAEVQAAPAAPEASADEKLKKDLDESKYQDS